MTGFDCSSQQRAEVAIWVSEAFVAMQGVQQIVEQRWIAAQCLFDEGRVEASNFQTNITSVPRMNAGYLQIAECRKPVVKRKSLANVPFGFIVKKHSILAQFTGARSRSTQQRRFREAQSESHRLQTIADHAN